MTEKILETFKSLGFELEDLEEIGYGFQYESINFIWMTNEDTKFLNIGIPGVLDKKDGDELMFYQLIDKLNGTFKYVKVNTLGDSMWLFYERELLDSDENLEEIISKMVVHLEASLEMFRMILKEANENSDENTYEGNDESETFTEAIEVSDDEENENE